VTRRRDTVGDSSQNSRNGTFPRMTMGFRPHWNGLKMLCHLPEYELLSPVALLSISNPIVTSPTATAPANIYAYVLILSPVHTSKRPTNESHHAQEQRRNQVTRSLHAMCRFLNTRNASTCGWSSSSSSLPWLLLSLLLPLGRHVQIGRRRRIGSFWREPDWGT